MDRLDLRKTDKILYAPSAKAVSVVDVPTLHFLQVDGRGDPNTSPDYAAAVQALFSLSYALKFDIKKSPLALDYGVMPLEGLWWVDDMARFSVADKSDWHWTAMIRQPECVTPERVEAMRDALRKKKGKDLPALDRLRFEPFTEGRCAQILHVGPFSDEGPTIEKLHAHIAALGGTLTGRHHEIYLSDISRAAPATWKTVLRQPFRLA